MTGLGSIDLALLALRVAIGIGSFVHGKNKLGKVHLFAADHHLPMWLAWIATVVQIAGGIAIVFGIATPVAAAALAKRTMFRRVADETS
jgi:putative oxidoreductase